MKLFSLIYDPITSSPFAVMIKSSPNDESILAITDRAKETYFSYGYSFVPEGMVKTPYGPLTAKAQEKVSSMIAGDDFFPLSEIREMLSPTYVYVGRKMTNITANEKSVNFKRNSHGFSQGSLDYRTTLFITHSKQISALSHMKASHVFFDPITNRPSVLPNDAGYGYEGERIETSVGRSSARRMGLASKNYLPVPYSTNSRINRRVKSLIGVDYVVGQGKSIQARIFESKIEYSRRRGRNGQG